MEKEGRMLSGTWGLTFFFFYPVEFSKYSGFVHINDLPPLIVKFYSMVYDPIVTDSYLNVSRMANSLFAH